MPRTASAVNALVLAAALASCGRAGGTAHRQIVFEAEIYTMDADGSNVRRLTFNEHRDNHPDW